MDASLETMKGPASPLVPAQLRVLVRGRWVGVECTRNVLCKCICVLFEKRFYLVRPERNYRCPKRGTSPQTPGPPSPLPNPPRRAGRSLRPRRPARRDKTKGAQSRKQRSWDEERMPKGNLCAGHLKRLVRYPERRWKALMAPGRNLRWRSLQGTCTSRSARRIPPHSFTLRY